MNTGERIKKRRNELGLSVDEVAERLGKNRATVYRYENNDIENLPTTVLEPLADILKTTPAFLMGWDEQDIFDTYQFHDYLDEYVHEIGEFLYHNPEHKVLFDSSMEVKNQDIGLAKQMLDRINGKQSTTESYYLNAARERTDIEVTDEMKKHDDDIMNDENF